VNQPDLEKETKPEDEMSESADPWNQPDEATKAAAKPIEEELEAKLKAINTPAKADALIERLATDVKGQKAAQFEDKPAPAGDAPPEVQAAVASEVVEGAGEAQPNKAAGKAQPNKAVDEAAATIESIAQMALELEGPAYEALVEAVQQVTDPGLRDNPEKLEEPRRYLWDAMMKNRGLNRIQKYDTALFIIINNGPHPRWLNTFFQQLSFVYNGGWAWIIGVALFWPFRRTRPEATRVLKGISVPIWVAALIVEGPIKKYFRRRRPFIDVVRAIVVGKKPGNWSFPSGHAAAAFGGAWVMHRCLPKGSAIWYALAGLVAFSRVYLGAHYPGDVLSGSVLGTIAAEGTRRLMRRLGIGQG
jgi:undecaprenyl-diphosphatase